MSRDAVIAICTRLASSRLPGKALATAEGLSLIEHIILRTKDTLPVWLCVPPSDADVYRAIARRFPWVNVFVGHPESPLHRTAELVRAHMPKPGYLVRVTHDDPLTDAKTMMELVAECSRQGAGYGKTPGILEGAGVEVIASENILAAAEKKREPTEYLTYFVRGDGMPLPGTVSLDPRLSVRSTHRLTIDYPEDLTALRVVLRAVGAMASVDNIVRYLDVHPFIADINRQPDVTFYTCARDAEPWVEDTIRSILGAATNMEYILVDDGSRDRTLEVMARYASDPRVRLIVNDSNVGLASSSNIAVAKARGRVVVRVDADDLLLPAFGRAWPALLDRVKFGEQLIYPAYEEINEYGGIESYRLESCDYCGVDPRRDHHAGCAIMDRAFLNEIKYRDGIRWWDGLDLYKRAVQVGKIGYLDTPIWQYRQHSDSMSHTNISEREAALKAIRVGE